MAEEIKDVSVPKIGVYVCHCGSNIAKQVDVYKAIEYASTLPNVAVAREYKFMCSEPGQEIIKKDIRELGITRVVVAACSPLMHELTFRKAAQSAGLNQYLVQIANIREQVSWVTKSKEAATNKAKAFIHGAVNKATHLEPLQTRKVKINPATLVVGAGIAGIQAALDIAEAGFKVFLVERDSTIGGRMARFDKTFPTLDCAACILTPKMVSVAHRQNIEIMASSEVEDVSGYIGNFKVKVRKHPRYVNHEKCTACTACWNACPAKLMPENRKILRGRTLVNTRSAGGGE
jgi:heterodisulfide reductase subunit A